MPHRLVAWMNVHKITSKLHSACLCRNQESLTHRQCFTIIVVAPPSTLIAVLINFGQSSTIIIAIITIIVVVSRSRQCEPRAYTQRNDLQRLTFPSSLTLGLTYVVLCCCAASPHLHGHNNNSIQKKRSILTMCGQRWSQATQLLLQQK